MYQYYEDFGVNSNTQLVIEDPENWGWSVAFVDAGTPVIIPGQTRTVQPKCPPGCPPFTQSLQIKSIKRQIKFKAKKFQIIFRNFCRIKL